MASFTHTWGQTSPIGTDAANQIDDYIRVDTKQALSERSELEHYALDSAEAGATDKDSANAQGRHIPGKVGILAKDTEANVLAISGAGDGALAYATDTAKLYRYDRATGNGWEVQPFTSGLVAGDAILVDAGTNTISVDVAEADDLIAGTANKMVDAAFAHRSRVSPASSEEDIVINSGDWFDIFDYDFPFRNADSSWVKVLVTPLTGRVSSGSGTFNFRLTLDGEVLDTWTIALNDSVDTTGVTQISEAINTSAVGELKLQIQRPASLNRTVTIREGVRIFVEDSVANEITI